MRGTVAKRLRRQARAEESSPAAIRRRYKALKRQYKARA